MPTSASPGIRCVSGESRVKVFANVIALSDFFHIAMYRQLRRGVNFFGSYISFFFHLRGLRQWRYFNRLVC